MSSILLKINSQVPALPPKKKITPLYLDDYTPVRTIEVSNYADDICPEYLRGFFECAAGPVSDVHVVTSHKSHDKRSLRVTYVTFQIPEDAAKLICDPDLPYSFRFTIKQAESQPKIDPNSMKFEEVIDDCMLVIASHLDLIDIVNLGKSSTRFQSFVQQIYRKKIHFSFGTNAGDSSINKSNLGTILEEIGVYIESIEWNDLQANELDFLSKNCPNVTALKLMNVSPKLNAQIFKRNKKFFKKLEKLHIRGGSLFDTSLKTMVSSPALQTLFIDCCHNVRGKFLSRCKSSKLKVLKMENLFAIDQNEIFNFVRTRKLTIFKCGKLSFRQLFDLPAESLTDFETLSLTFSSTDGDALDSFNFKDLKQLINLNLNMVEAVALPNHGKTLAAVCQIPALQSLTIEGLVITTDTLNGLVSFKNLRKICFIHLENAIGKQFYTSLHVHLPNITELIMVQYQIDETIELKWICELVTSLKELKYFTLSWMTWQLMNMILQDRMRLKLPPIEIRMWSSVKDDEEKIKFDATNKGAIKVSSYDRFVPDFV